MSYGTYWASEGAYDFKQEKPTKLGKWLCKHNFHKFKPFIHWDQYQYNICVRCRMQGRA